MHEFTFLGRHSVKVLVAIAFLAIPRAGGQPLAAQQDVLIADFEGDDYGEWKATGKAFGIKPAPGTVGSQMSVSGFRGKGLVNSFMKVDQDRATGTLTSPEFVITRDYIVFLIGGGRIPDELGMELLIDGKRVRSVTGIDSERLQPRAWDVSKLNGKSARLRIYDRSTGGWGHINVDHIVQSNSAPYREMRLSEYRKSKQYYKERYRPQYHFTPEMNWMNDPNGLVYFEGEYHLFYQHNPHGNQWGHMSWGHAVSRDLVHWKHLPIALHDEHGVMVFSGCCVIDWKNTSGLGINGRPPMVAIYTGHGFEKQTQDIAFSNDRGRTWTKYKGNPVLDLDEKDFRDPKVFWHEETGKWVMVVSLAVAKRLQFYQSPDLKKWELTSEFGPAGVKNKPNWECPDLFELPVIDPINGKKIGSKWVLEVDMGGGSIAGGSGGEYFVGDFDGKKFVCDDPDKTSQWVDFGRDFYAPVSFSDIPAADGRRIWLGWMNNWETSQLPTSRWRSAMSIPRTLSLRKTSRGYVLVQTPVRELVKLRGSASPVRGKKIANNEVVDLLGHSQPSTCLEIVAEIQVDRCKQTGFHVRTSRDGREKTIVGYDRQKQELFVDRTLSGDVQFDKRFPGRHAAPLKSKDGKIRLRIFVDASSVEVFAEEGAVVLTERIFPDPQSTGLQFYSRGPASLHSLEVYPLQSIWNSIRK